ncbi:MAG: hypothetical protein LHW48_02870, partial [Candidatus Cloacimonetes bacterium]|nr:hypothetical protein [Candidatus Cloacimonadota bacterium]
MSEYTSVERPFLDKLQQLGWEVIDQGTGFTPYDPSISRRESFREYILENEFSASLKRINLTEDGRSWLTDKQLEAVLSELTMHPGMDLLKANQAVFELLTRNTTVDQNTLTGEQNPTVRLIDFANPERNSFIAINQFKIETPGASKQAIIPDIVLFINGLPIVVVECKDMDVAQPLSEAFIQINRYANLRVDDYGIKEGEERLFHCNLFNIVTHGNEARFGTITGEFDHYLNWKDIFPEEYKTISVSPDEQR